MRYVSKGLFSYGLIAPCTLRRLRRVLYNALENKFGFPIRTTHSLSSLLAGIIR